MTADSKTEEFISMQRRREITFFQGRVDAKKLCHGATMMIFIMNLAATTSANAGSIVKIERFVSYDVAGEYGGKAEGTILFEPFALGEYSNGNARYTLGGPSQVEVNFTTSFVRAGSDAFLPFTVDIKVPTLGGQELSWPFRYRNSVDTPAGTSFHVGPTQAVNFPSLGRTGSWWPNPPPLNQDFSILGDIPFEVSTSKSANVVSADWRWFGQFKLSLEYESKTTSDYVKGALGRFAHGTTIERAQNSYLDIIALRDKDAGTASSNLELRNAEYALRGYTGGLQNRQGSPLDFSSFEKIRDEYGNRFGPISLAQYNAIKGLAGYLGVNIAGPGEHLPTPPGGYRENLQGWIAGWLGETPDELLTRLTSTGTSPTDHSQVQLPTFSRRDANGAFDIFEFGAVEAGKALYIDPPEAELMMYGVAGNSISSVRFIADSNRPLDLYFEDGQHRKISTNETFSFLSSVPGGVEGFAVSGVGHYDVNGKEAVVGLWFTDSGPTLVTAMAGASSVSPVPEPSTAASVIFGLLVMCSARLRNRGERKSERGNLRRSA